MARPQKQGLEYFSLDVDMDQDDKILLIEAKHGITGFAIVVKLLMKIYKEGYFYKWEEREQLLFSSKVNIDINSIKIVVDDCLKWGVFDKELFEKYAILTSSGIQKRYFEAISRRKEVEVIYEYLLINLPENDTMTVNIVNVDINEVNVNNNSLEGGLMSTLIPKVKESKVKDINAHFDVFWKAYPRKKSKGQAEKAWKKIQVDEQLLATMIAKIEQAKKSTAWIKDGGKWIPYPSTWLNAKGWEDEDISQMDKPSPQNGPLGVTCDTRPEDLVRRDDM
ncbi:MAG TPA: DUF4373 domain-containing protein [Desulfitobacterium dehalogenans]|uniref:DUF4373 domain-containing protein n=1 Tax=Desulfitobacterium dehalogenans TaxID=36854 RepID=A0A7C6Z3P8_9FIRM|nr:DUF4373 domain-containing protein [Desulfitobacterium dehalogenans]